MKAFIFAAGLGTRLKPITDTMPKALVEVCGKPLLRHVMEKLKAAGFTEVVINIHHFAHKIEEYVAQNNDIGMSVTFSNETDMLLDTGGGIKHAAAALGDKEPFFVHNVDILSDLDIRKFIESHLGTSVNFTSATAVANECGSMPLATLLVSKRDTQRYLLFNADNNLAGWMNVKTGEVRSPYRALRRSAAEGAVFGLGDGTQPKEYFDSEAFLQKFNLKKYAFDGAHVISPQIFELMKDWPQKFSIIDFYLDVCSRYDIKFYIQPGLQMIDVGKLGSLQQAEDLVVKLSGHEAQKPK